jgi:hypothetical protein
MDDDFQQMTDEELAAALAEEVGVELPTALRAVRSSDPDLGRPYAIRILEARTRHRDRQQQLTTHRRNLRNLV